MRLQEFLLSEGIEDKGIFKAVFMAGHPGAGKTFVLNSIRSGQIEPRWVNTDKVFIDKKRLDRMNPDSMFKHFRENWDDGWPLISDKVKRINKTQLELYINSMLPLAVDGTSNSISVLNTRRGLLEGFGYDTAMVFVNTDLETAMKRAALRERPVDPEFIKNAYDEINKNKGYYRSKFGEWIEVDNGEGELTEKTITRAFKMMSSFYNSPIVNPTGQQNIKVMRENGWKYLHPEVRDMSQIKKMVSVWYKS